jgi:hypothetical protein
LGPIRTKSDFRIEVGAIRTFFVRDDSSQNRARFEGNIIMLPWDISQRCNPTQAKRPSVPLVNLDRSGRVKADTLEFFATKPGWHSPSDLRVDPVLGAIYPRFPDNKSIQMRLMRYSRLGILKRRRAGRKYFYSITQAGKKRLVYFWEKLGYLDQA